MREHVRRRGETVRQRGGEDRWRGKDAHMCEWHIENLDFRQLVRHRLLSSGCPCPWNEQCEVRFLSALTGALGETDGRPGHSAHPLRLANIPHSLHRTRIVVSFHHFPSPLRYETLIPGYYCHRQWIQLSIWKLLQRYSIYFTAVSVTRWYRRVPKSFLT